jgi:hypothetical protein
LLLFGLCTPSPSRPPRLPTRRTSTRAPLPFKVISALVTETLSELPDDVEEAADEEEEDDGDDGDDDGEVDYKKYLAPIKSAHTPTERRLRAEIQEKVKSMTPEARERMASGDFVWAKMAGWPHW